jgi:hypothetical protein
VLVDRQRQHLVGIRHAQGEVREWPVAHQQ